MQRNVWSTALMTIAATGMLGVVAAEACWTPIPCERKVGRVNYTDWVRLVPAGWQRRVGTCRAKSAADDR